MAGAGAGQMNGTGTNDERMMERIGLTERRAKTATLNALDQPENNVLMGWGSQREHRARSGWLT